MSAMNRALIKKQLNRGLNTVFGLEYKRYPEEWRSIFDLDQSDKAWEEDQLVVGLPGAKVKAEGKGVDYAVGGEGWTARYVHDTVALAFAITEEAQEDNLYMRMGAKYSKALARSFVHTKEIKGANVLNFGFTAGQYAGGDGVALYSTAHPLFNGDTAANTLATQADLSEAALEDMLTLMSNCVDDQGIPVSMGAVRLIVPPALRFTAHRLLRSTGRPGTPDNDPNAIRAMGELSDVAVNRRLTDANSWHIKTDVNDGLKHFVRVAMMRGMEGDFESGNLRYKARERYSFGFTDWRGAFGCSGAN